MAIIQRSKIELESILLKNTSGTSIPNGSNAPNLLVFIWSDIFSSLRSPQNHSPWSDPSKYLSSSSPLLGAMLISHFFVIRFMQCLFHATWFEIDNHYFAHLPLSTAKHSSILRGSETACHRRDSQIGYCGVQHFFIPTRNINGFGANQLPAALGRAGDQQSDTEPVLSIWHVPFQLLANGRRLVKLSMGGGTTKMLIL